MLMFIGASAHPDVLPCQTYGAWDNLLDAMSRDDHEAILRITLGSDHVLTPTANLRDVQPNPPKTLVETADAFWRKRNNPAAKEPSAIASPFVASEPDGTPVFDPNSKLRFRPRPQS